LIITAVSKYFSRLASITRHHGLTVLVLGLLAVMLTAPFIAGRILDIAQAPKLKKKHQS